MLRSPDDSAGRLDVTLVALTGRDTARVVLRLDGDNGLGKSTGWMNRFEYEFTRDSTSALWRLTARRGTYFADYYLDEPSHIPLPSCLNGRR